MGVQTLNCVVYGSRPIYLPTADGGNVSGRVLQFSYWILRTLRPLIDRYKTVHDLIGRELVCGSAEQKSGGGRYRTLITTLLV